MAHIYQGFDFSGRAERVAAQARAKERIPLLVAELKKRMNAGELRISRENIMLYIRAGDFIGAEQYLIRVLRDLPEVRELDRDIPRDHHGNLSEIL